MKDFFDTWKFKILVGIAVFLVGIMAYAGANGRLTAAPQELLSVAAAPFQKVAAVVSGGVASLWEKYTSIDDVMAENETLKAENAELRQQMVDYDRVKAENQAYKALESIQSQRPEMSYLSSFVIGRDPLDSFYGFTLDRGTLDGVAVNDAVVSDQGYLLGMVVEAEPTSCKVMTILHPNFNAAGVVSRTRDNGIVTGSSEYAADGLCMLTNLARNTLTEKSDQVVTTGLGGVFPADLLVGVVQEPRGQRQIDHCCHQTRYRPPHGAPCVHHYQFLRRDPDGITPETQPGPDRQMDLLCAAGSSLCCFADHARAVPVRGGKAALAAAAGAGGRRV